MVKILRKLQKIFSLNGDTGQFGSAQATTKILSKDLDTLQDLTAYNNGWDDAILGGEKLPPMEEMNSLSYIFSNQIKYLLQEGIAEYLSTTEYYINSIVKESGTSKLYNSLTDNNIGNPLTDTVNWKFLIDLNSTKGTVSNEGFHYYKNSWIWGLISKSSAGDPTEDIDITKGKAICEDGSTIVELLSDTVDIDMPTILGGVLTALTYYHLYRYLKNDDTMQWHLSTSLTPTITDIKSALAYRRIVSFLTDVSGDIITFYGFKKENGGIIIKIADTIIHDAPSPTTISIPTPNNVECYPIVYTTVVDDDGGGTILSVSSTIHPFSQRINESVNTSPGDNDLSANTIKHIPTNNSQLIFATTGADNILIIFQGFIDNRII